MPQHIQSIHVLAQMAFTLSESRSICFNARRVSIWAIRHMSSGIQKLRGKYHLRRLAVSTCAACLKTWVIKDTYWLRSVRLSWLMHSAPIHIGWSGENDQICFMADSRFGVISTPVDRPATQIRVPSSRSHQLYERTLKSGPLSRFAFCSTVVNGDSPTNLHGATLISFGSNLSKMSRGCLE